MDPFTSALDIAKALRARDISPVEVADAYLARMDRLDPELNAFCFRDDQRVRASAADAADRIASTPPEELPPFCGVPLPIKDLNAVAGWPTTYGSRAASGTANVESDPVVSRLVEAGFIPLGMTCSPELGAISMTESTAFGVTRNPWNPAHTPGGSSGGAAAAVASGMAPIAQASDGAGSIRIPASCCGLVGLKPSRSRVPNTVNLLEGFTTAGVLSRDIADTAALLDVLGRPDPLGWYNAPTPTEPFAQSAKRDPGVLRVRVQSTPFLPMEVAPACAEAVVRTAAALEALGHDVEEMPPLEVSTDAILEAFGSIWSTGSAGVRFDDWDGVEPLNAALRAAGRRQDSITYVQAVQTAQVYSRYIVGHLVTHADIVLTPTMSVEPPLCGSVWKGADTDPMAPFVNCFPMGIFTVIWNMCGLPAMSLPVHMSPSGLPVGVQIVAGPWREDLVLQVGRQLEEALPWAGRRAPMATL